MHARDWENVGDPASLPGSFRAASSIPITRICGYRHAGWGQDVMPSPSALPNGDSPTIHVPRFSRTPAVLSIALPHGPGK